MSMPFISPTGIVPLGPIIDFTTSHGREKMTGQNSLSAIDPPQAADGRTSFIGLASCVFIGCS